jgi:hypothetical protein
MFQLIKKKRSLSPFTDLHISFRNLKIKIIQNKSIIFLAYLDFVCQYERQNQQLLHNFFKP